MKKLGEFITNLALKKVLMSRGETIKHTLINSKLIIRKLFTKKMIKLMQINLFYLI